MFFIFKHFPTDYHDNSLKPLNKLSSTLRSDVQTTPNRFKSTSESPFPRKLRKKSLKPLDFQNSSKDLRAKDAREPRTHSQKQRISSSISPNQGNSVNVKDALKFLNPIEEILPKGSYNNLKKKTKNTTNKPKPLKAGSRNGERLENGLVFIAKNMKIVDERFKNKDKRKEPVFLTQIQTIFKVFLKFFSD